MVVKKLFKSFGINILEEHVCFLNYIIQYVLSKSGPSLSDLTIVHFSSIAKLLRRLWTD